MKRIVLLFLLLCLPTIAFAGARKSAESRNRHHHKAHSKCAKCLRASKGQPCHPANYVDPTIQKNLHSAVKDMNRTGIRPKITSAWRSSSKQAFLYKCSRNNKCRVRNPGIYYAKAPGSSLHEAGFAVDIADVAAGRRGSKRVTPKGRKIIRIMERHGFNWRYGLSDPPHFEANPKKHGYRTVAQAIRKTQTTCQYRFSKSRAH